MAYCVLFVPVGDSFVLLVACCLHRSLRPQAIAGPMWQHEGSLAVHGDSPQVSSYV